MSTSLLLRSTLPRHIARKPTLAGAVWLRKAQASTTAAAQEDGEFKYVPGGREFSSLLFFLWIFRDGSLILDANAWFLGRLWDVGVEQLFTREP